MAQRYRVEYSTENPAYVEGRAMWKWFIGFLVFIILVKVIS